MALPYGKQMLNVAANPRDTLTMAVHEMQDILQRVGKNPHITILSFQGNVLQPAAVAALCDFLRSNATLRSLNLSMCGLGNNGALCVIRALCTTKRMFQSRLVKLNLSLNGITPEGIPAIAQALKLLTTPLTSLVLRYNAISLHNVATLVRMGGTLRRLDCSYCGIGTDNASLQQMVQALRENVTIVSLLLDGNNILPHAVQTLGEAAKKNTQSQLGESGVSCNRGTVVPKELNQYFLGVRREDGLPNGEVYDEIARIEGEVSVGRINPRNERRGEGPPRRSASQGRVEESMENDSFCRTDPYRRTETMRDVMQRHCLLGHMAPPDLSRKYDQCMSARGERSGQAAKKETAAPVPVPPAAASPGVVEQAAPVDDRASTNETSQLAHASNDVSPIRPVNGSTMAARNGSQRRDSGAPEVSKGRMSRLLLNRCVVDQRQCEEILQLKDKSALRRGGGLPEGVPLDLVQHSALPQVLAELPFHSRDKIYGLAKLLFFVLRGPVDEGRFESEDDVAHWTDIPPTLPKDSAAKFRSARVSENNEARRLLASLTTNRGRGREPTRLTGVRSPGVRSRSVDMRGNVLATQPEYPLLTFPPTLPQRRSASAGAQRRFV